MSTYERAHYSDGTPPRIVEVRDDGQRRIVSEQHARYAALVAAGNTPTPVSGDRFVTIVNGQPVVDPNKQATLTAEKWVAVRAERNARINAADWTQLEDAPFDASKKHDWKKYRQALRDLPQTQTDPFNIVWPTPPKA